MKYKKGDVVICVGKDDVVWHDKGAGWEPGLIFAVTEVTRGIGVGGMNVLWGGANGGSGVFDKYVRPFENKLSGWYLQGKFIPFKDMTREQLVIALSECYQNKDNYQSSKAVSLEKELVKRLQA